MDPPLSATIDSTFRSLPLFQKSAPRGQDREMRRDLRRGTARLPGTWDSVKAERPSKPLLAAARATD